MTPERINFMRKAIEGAKAAGHPWEEYAACEAALESAWGTSKLARMANNLLGRKASKDFTGPVLVLETREYINRQWITVPARWMFFKNYEECFRDRMDLLRRLAPKFKAYQAALAAQSGEEFVTEVSKSWSTDPKRSQKVLEIYKLWEIVRD